MEVGGGEKFNIDYLLLHEAKWEASESNINVIELFRDILVEFPICYDFL